MASPTRFPSCTRDVVSASWFAIRLPWYLKTARRYHFLDFVDFLLQPLEHLQYSAGELPQDMETKVIQESGDSLHTRMFVWLMQISPNPSARAIIALDPNDLVHIQPPVTSTIEWAKALQQAISVQLTSPGRRLDEDSFRVYARLTGTHWMGFTGALLSVHRYCCTTSVTHYAEEHAYDISSTVDWNRDARAPVLNQPSTCEIFLQRFCLHTL